MELTPTIVNIAVFGVVLISAMLAYARGLTREAVTLAIWIGAALVALSAYPTLEPFVRDFQDLGEWTKWAAIGLAFVIALLAFTLIGSAVSSLIGNSPLRGIDKGLGFIFGAARGLLILAISWIGYEQIVKPEYTHAAIEGSKGGALVKDSADYLVSKAPDDWPDFIKTAMTDLMGSDDEETVEAGASTSEAPPAPPATESTTTDN